MGNNFLPPRKLLPGTIPRDTLSLPSFVQMFEHSQTDLKTGLQMFPSSFAAQT